MAQKDSSRVQVVGATRECILDCDTCCNASVICSLSPSLSLYLCMRIGGKLPFMGERL